jgi:hypothetical protein
MTTRLSIVAAVLLSSLVMGTGRADAQTVSGQFVLGGKPLEPAHVAAFRMRDQNAPRSMETYVMLTLTPVNISEISKAIDPYMVAINDPAVMKADYLALQVAANGETRLNAHVGGTQYLDSSGFMMGMAGSLVATCQENTPARVACTVRTSKPVKPMDGPVWTLDVTFAAPVSARVAGKPMPPDGGPAGKALLALTTAVGGKDLSKILAGLTPEQAKSYQEDWRSPAENLASAKDILSVRLPKQPKITGGELVADDYAVLEVEGVPFAGSKMLYLVEMRLVAGRWLYANSSNVGMLR